MKSTLEVLQHYSEAAGLNQDIQPIDIRNGLEAAWAASPYLMAPMAGVSDKAYRIMARAAGAGLAWSEMVSVAGIHYKSDKTWDLVMPDAAEPDIAIQLFGSKPEQFAQAANLVQSRLGSRLALIDINMACPVPKVVRKGEGSALMDTPELAKSIVDACVRNCQVPVTVKIRAGRRQTNYCAPEFALAMEGAGASCVAVHGRFATQMYTGEANWDIISQVRNTICIPTIASGDIFNAQACVDVMEQTKASAVFCARGTYGNPWIFKDAKQIASGNPCEMRSVEMRMSAFMCHVRLLEATGAHIARARSLAGWYFKGIPGAATLRASAVKMNTADEFCDLARQACEAYDRYTNQ